MVKSVDAKPVGTLAKKSPMAKFKSQQIAKKNGSKRAETEKDADRRQPKDRDPANATVTPEWSEAKKKVFQKLWPVVQSLKIDPIDVKGFCELAAELSDEESAGNFTFRRWLEIKEEAFQQPLPTYEASFTDQFGCDSVEDRVEKLFSDHDQNWESVFRFLMNALDPDEVEQEPDMYLWSFRYMSMMISINHPFKFFRVNDYFDLPKRQKESSFWNEDGFGLELKSENAMAVYYAMTTLILGDPWVYYFNIHLGTETQFKFKEERLNLQLARAYQDHEDQKKLDQKKSQQDQGNSGPDKQTRAKSLADWSKDLLDANGELINDETEVDKKVKSFLSSTAATSEEIIEFEKPKAPLRTKGVQFSKGEAITTPSHTVVTQSGGDESISELTSNEQEGRQSFSAAVMKVPSPPKTHRTSSTKLDSSFWDLDQKISELIQMDLEGIPGQAKIFDVTMALTWSGDSSSPNSLTDRWILHTKDMLKEVVSNSPHGLFVMPIDDTEYKDKEKWIRTTEAVESKITSYYELITYLDPHYGNASYFTTSYKVGEKKLRTRFRFGFNFGVDPERVRNFLHMGIRTQGRGAGCFDTPLQFSPIDRTGFNCFWPEDINKQRMLKELFAHCECRYAIGMAWGWVTLPYTGRSRFNDDSPGCQLYHFFAKRSEAAEVDRMLRSLLNPATPISELPFNGSAHYVHDWSSAKEGVLSVRANGMVKNLVLTMVTKATDYQDLTVVLYPTVRIIGLLKKAQTTHFGEVSLLRLLLSITCTPAQAAAADDEVGAGDEDPDSKDTDTNDLDEEGYRKVKVVRKKSKKTKEEMDRDPSLLTLLDDDDGKKKPASKAERALERKRQLDRENFTKCRLFLNIFPGEMFGTQVMVSRVKFESLARNVLRDIILFLECHLNEPTRESLVNVLRKWFPRAEIERALDSGKRWSTKSFQAKREGYTSSRMDDGLAFLDSDFGADILDVFDGILGIDLEMAHSRDIDDGATVSREMEMNRRTEDRLRDQDIEITLQNTQIIEQSQEIEKSKKRLEAADAEAAKLRAELDALKAKTNTNQAEATPTEAAQTAMAAEMTPSPARRAPKPTEESQQMVVETTPSPARAPTGNSKAKRKSTMKSPPPTVTPKTPTTDSASLGTLSTKSNTMSTPGAQSSIQSFFSPQAQPQDRPITRSQRRKEKRVDGSQNAPSRKPSSATGA